MGIDVLWAGRPYERTVEGGRLLRIEVTRGGVIVEVDEGPVYGLDPDELEAARRQHGTRPRPPATYEVPRHNEEQAL